MIRTHFDPNFHSHFGYLVIAVGERDRLLVVNPAVVSAQPFWMREHLMNQALEMADDMPAAELAKVIDLVKVRAELRVAREGHGCPKSTSPMIATDR